MHIVPSTWIEARANTPRQPRARATPYVRALLSVFITLIAGASAIAQPAVGTTAAPASTTFGLEVVVLVDVSSRAGDIGAHTIRGVVTTLYDALQPGDHVTIVAATRHSPVEVLSIVVRETDDPSALVARSWRERAEPLAGRSADVARGLSRFLEARGNNPLHLLVILPSTRLGAEDASAIWAGAKAARDREALVWAAGPDDADLRHAATTGVLNWTSIDRADPAAWVNQARRRHGGPSLHETVNDLQEQVAGLSADLQAKQADLSEARREIGNRDGQINTLNSELAARDGRINELARELNAAVDGRHAAEADAAAARATADAQERSAAETRQRAEAAAVKALSLATQLDEANEARVRAEQNINDLRAEHEAARTEWEGRFGAAEGELESFRSGIASLRAENARLTREVIAPSTPSAQTVSVQEAETAEESRPETQTAGPQGGEVTTGVSPELLALAGAAGIGLIVIVAVGRATVARRAAPRVVTLRCRAAAGDAWAPVEVALKRHEAIVVGPERPPAAEAIDKIDGAAHLVVRGDGLELRDQRPGAALQVNEAEINGTRARVGLGDRVRVRHPDGRSTSLIVSAIKKSTRPRSAAANGAPVASPA